MKPFDLQAALGGAKVVTRGGRAVSQLTKFEDTSPGGDEIAAVVDGAIVTYNIDGTWIGDEHPLDLVMDTTEKTMWVTVYTHESGVFAVGHIYNTKEEADRAVVPDGGGRKYLGAHPITFEL